MTVSQSIENVLQKSISFKTVRFETLGGKELSLSIFFFSKLKGNLMHCQLFSSFPWQNDICSGSGSRNGTCFTSEECENKGGGGKAQSWILHNLMSCNTNLAWFDQSRWLCVGIVCRRLWGVLRFCPGVRQHDQWELHLPGAVGQLNGNQQPVHLHYLSLQHQHMQDKAGLQCMALSFVPHLVQFWVKYFFVPDFLHCWTSNRKHFDHRNHAQHKWWT